MDYSSRFAAADGGDGTKSLQNPDTAPRVTPGTDEFTTIDVSSAAVGNKAEKTVTWQNISLQQRQRANPTLPLYKTQTGKNKRSDDPKDLVVPGTYSSFSNRRRRLLSILLCLVVCAVSILLVTGTINWAEQNRNTENNDKADLEIELRSLEQKIDSMHLQLNKLKEITYANSVAIYEITDGALKIPGADGSSTKRQKFGKNASSINQGATHQRFDKSNIARTATHTPSAPAGDLELHPIVHDAEIS